MLSFRKKNSQSRCLVKELLSGNLFQETAQVSIRTHNFSCGEKVPFDPKGSARIEILFDTLTAEKNNDQIMLHGLVESIDEQRIALTFFCETTWIDKQYLRKRESVEWQDKYSSLIVDFDEEAHDLSSASFEVIFNADENDAVIGYGSGYLRFEPGSVSNRGHLKQ